MLYIKQCKCYNSYIFSQMERQKKTDVTMLPEPSPGGDYYGTLFESEKSITLGRSTSKAGGPSVPHSDCKPEFVSGLVQVVGQQSY